MVCTWPEAAALDPKGTVQSHSASRKPPPALTVGPFNVARLRRSDGRSPKMLPSQRNVWTVGREREPRAAGQADLESARLTLRLDS